jgi:hypothetical protein
MFFRRETPVLMEEVMSTTASAQFSPGTLNVFFYDGAKQKYEKSYSHLRTSVQSIGLEIEKLANRVEVLRKSKGTPNLEKTTKAIQANLTQSDTLQEKIDKLSKHLGVALISMRSASTAKETDSSDKTEKAQRKLSEVEFMKTDVDALESQMKIHVARIKAIAMDFESFNKMTSEEEDSSESSDSLTPKVSPWEPRKNSSSYSETENEWNGIPIYTTPPQNPWAPSHFSPLGLSRNSRTSSSSSSSFSSSSSSIPTSRSIFSTSTYSPPCSPVILSRNYSIMQGLRNKDPFYEKTPPRKFSLIKSPSDFGIDRPPPFLLSSFSPHNSPKITSSRQLPAISQQGQDTPPNNSPKAENRKVSTTEPNRKKPGEITTRSRSNSLESGLGNCITRTPRKWQLRGTSSSRDYFGEKASIWIHINAIDKLASTLSVALQSLDYTNYPKKLEFVKEHCNAIIEILREEEPVYFQNSDLVMNFIDLRDTLRGVSDNLHAITQNGERIRGSQIAVTIWGERIFDVLDRLAEVDEVSSDIGFFVKRIQTSSNLIAWKINEFCLTVFPSPVAQLLVEYFGAFETDIRKSALR